MSFNVMEVVGINGLFRRQRSILLRYDSIYGRFGATVNPPTRP